MKKERILLFWELKFNTTGAVSGGVRFAAREILDDEGCCNFMFFSSTAGSHGRILRNGVTSDLRFRKCTLSGRSNKTGSRTSVGKESESLIREREAGGLGQGSGRDEDGF